MLERPKPVPRAFVERLRALLGRDGVIAGADELLVYECDAYTIEKQLPGVVALPQTTGEVAAVVRLCAEAQLPIIQIGRAHV